MDDQTDDPQLHPYAEQFTHEEIAAHQKSQSTWPATTDCDRLDAAFAELNEEGIVARQNFTCCQTCGNAEILDEIKAAQEEGKKPSGYTYYHMQDTERGVEGTGLYLAYAAEDDAVAVAKQIIDTLQRHGLKPQWNGSLDSRILVPMDWKRRR